jgi:hypothetical protein
MAKEYARKKTTREELDYGFWPKSAKSLVITSSNV